MSEAYRYAKRALDIVFAFLVLLALSPLMIALSIAVRVSLGRPVLFFQKRPGLNGRPFTLCKFRTMREACDSEGKPLPDAERLTHLGRFLRASSLDELPELINVVKGDMSIVGPRPLLMEYLDRYTPEQFRRHEVRPGITGWAQVNGRNLLSWEERFALDVWYVDRCSLVLDTKIVFMTVRTVLKREGISATDHVTMPTFRGSEDVSAQRSAVEPDSPWWNS